MQQWFSGCDSSWRDGILTASLDPYRGYATALTHSLPQAVRVLDAFHVVRLGQACVDEVRRRVQQQTLGRRGHRDDPLYRARRDLRRGLAHITDRQWVRLSSRWSSATERTAPRHLDGRPRAAVPLRP